MSGNMVFCRACGGTLHSTAPLCPHCGAPQGGGGDGITRTFGSSIAMCFSKYATFQGRAPRAEFWWFYLFVIIGMLVTSIIGGVSDSSALGGIAYGLFSLGILLPNLAVSVRRLHDTDRSGWWLLIMLIPLIGTILIIVWFCSRGTRGPNRFGNENGAVF